MNHPFRLSIALLRSRAKEEYFAYEQTRDAGVHDLSREHFVAYEDFQTAAAFLEANNPSAIFKKSDLIPAHEVLA